MEKFPGSHAGDSWAAIAWAGKVWLHIHPHSCLWKHVSCILLRFHHGYSTLGSKLPWRTLGRPFILCGIDEMSNSFELADVHTTWPTAARHMCLQLSSTRL